MDNPQSQQEQWRFLHFGTTANAGPAADGEDPDHDGQINLLEFGLGGDPHVSDPPPIRPTPPVGGFFEFHYPRAKAALGTYDFVVEFSDSLLPPWSDEGVVHTLLDDDGPVQSMKASIPVGTAGRRFVRLRLEPTP
jgi:hypothetical protein